jgi:pyrroline-5-carboxylate reductase
VTRLLLVGCGKMGGALLAGWLEQGVSPSDIVIVDPHFTRGADLPAALRVFAGPESLPKDFKPDLVLLAVKPQQMDEVLPAYRVFSDSLFLSIAAGRSLQSLAGLLGERAAIVRAMPNTPAAVRRGVTVMLANDHVGAPQRALCDRLMAAVGEVAWIADEAQMDAVTALSGSGPAYVFLLVEAMAAAGEDLGLAGQLAQTLARATVVGAGELLRQSPLPAATLRENVTSPNGTTFAALQVLGATGGLTDLLQRAMAAAARRSRELAG